MNLSKNAIGNLINRYKAVLKKCHLLNTFGSLAVAGMLAAGSVGVGVGDAGAESAGINSIDGIVVVDAMMVSDYDKLSQITNDYTEPTKQLEGGDLGKGNTGVAHSVEVNVVISGISGTATDSTIGDGSSLTLTGFAGTGITNPSLVHQKDMTVGSGAGDAAISYFILGYKDAITGDESGNLFHDGNITLSENGVLDIKYGDVFLGGTDGTVDKALILNDYSILNISDGGSLTSRGDINLDDDGASINVGTDGTKAKQTIIGDLTVSSAGIIEGATTTGYGEIGIGSMSTLNVHGNLNLGSGGDLAIAEGGTIGVGRDNISAGSGMTATAGVTLKSGNIVLGVEGGEINMDSEDDNVDPEVLTVNNTTGTSNLTIEGGNWTTAAGTQLNITDGVLDIQAGKLTAGDDITIGTEGSLNLASGATLDVSNETLAANAADLGAVDLTTFSFTEKAGLGTLVSSNTTELFINNTGVIGLLSADDLLKLQVSVGETLFGDGNYAAANITIAGVSINRTLTTISPGGSQEGQVNAANDVVGAGTFARTDENTFAGIVSDGSTADSIINSTGTLNLTGNGGVALSEGKITVNQGTLKLGYDGTTATAGGTVNGDLIVNQTAGTAITNVYGDSVNVLGTVSVDKGTLSVESNSTFIVGTANASKDVFIGKAGNSTITSSFTVDGETTIHGDLIVRDGATVDANADITADALNISGTVASKGFYEVADNTTSQYSQDSTIGTYSEVTVHGDLVFEREGSDVYINLDVTGAGAKLVTSATGKVSVNGDLNVTDGALVDHSLSDDFSVDGTINVSGNDGADPTPTYSTLKVADGTAGNLTVDATGVFNVTDGKTFEVTETSTFAGKTIDFEGDADSTLQTKDFKSTGESLTLESGKILATNSISTAGAVEITGADAGIQLGDESATATWTATDKVTVTTGNLIVKSGATLDTQNVDFTVADTADDGAVSVEGTMSAKLANFGAVDLTQAAGSEFTFGSKDVKKQLAGGTDTLLSLYGASGEISEADLLTLETEVATDIFGGGLTSANVDLYGFTVTGITSLSGVRATYQEPQGALAGGDLTYTDNKTILAQVTGDTASTVKGEGAHLVLTGMGEYSNGDPQTLLFNGGANAMTLKNGGDLTLGYNGGTAETTSPNKLFFNGDIVAGAGSVVTVEYTTVHMDNDGTSAATDYNDVDLTGGGVLNAQNGGHVIVGEITTDKDNYDNQFLESDKAQINIGMVGGPSSVTVKGGDFKAGSNNSLEIFSATSSVGKIAIGAGSSFIVEGVLSTSGFINQIKIADTGKIIAQGFYFHSGITLAGGDIEVNSATGGDIQGKLTVNNAGSSLIINSENANNVGQIVTTDSELRITNGALKVVTGTLDIGGNFDGILYITDGTLHVAEGAGLDIGGDNVTTNMIDFGTVNVDVTNGTVSYVDGGTNANVAVGITGDTDTKLLLNNAVTSAVLLSETDYETFIQSVITGVFDASAAAAVNKDYIKVAGISEFRTLGDIKTVAEGLELGTGDIIAAGTYAPTEADVTTTVAGIVTDPTIGGTGAHSIIDKADATLHLTGNGGIKLSEGNITVKAGTLILGFDGSVGTQSGALDGALTVGDASSTSDAKVEIFNETATVSGLTTVNSDGVLAVGVAGTLDAQGGIELKGGTFQVKGEVETTALTLGADFDYSKFTIASNKTVSVANKVSFAGGKTIDLDGDSTQSTDAGGLSVEGLEISGSGGLTIASGTIQANNNANDVAIIDNANKITLNGATASLTVNGNWTATSGATAADSSGLTVTNGIFTVTGNERVVDLSGTHVNFTAGIGAKLISEAGSNLIVGLGTVGLKADGTDSGTAATMKAGTVYDPDTLSYTDGANVDNLKGTVTIAGFNAQFDFANNQDKADFKIISDAGNTAFGTLTSIDYDGVRLTNTEKLTITEVAQNNYSGLGHAVVGVDSNGGGTIAAGEIARVGKIVGGNADATINNAGTLILSGVVNDGQGGTTNTGELYAGSIHSTGGLVNLGNGDGDTNIGGGITGSGDTQLTMNKVTTGTGGNGDVDMSGSSGVSDIENSVIGGNLIIGAGGALLIGKNKAQNFVAEGNVTIKLGMTSVSDTTNVSDQILTISDSGFLQTMNMDATNATVNVVSTAEKSGLNVTYALNDLGATFNYDPPFTAAGGIDNASGTNINTFANDAIAGRHNILQNTYLVMGDVNTAWAQEVFNGNNNGLIWNSTANGGNVTAALFLRTPQKIDGTTAGSAGSILVNGSLTSTSNLPTMALGDATFANNSLLVLDGEGLMNSTALTGIGSTAATGTLTIADGAKLHIVGGTTGTINIVDEFKTVTTGSGNGWTGANLTFDFSVFEGTMTFDANSASLTVTADARRGNYSFQDESVKYLNNMFETVGLHTLSTRGAGHNFLSRALSESYGMGILERKRTVATIEGAAQMAAVGNVNKAVMSSNWAAQGAVQDRNAYSAFNAMNSGEGSGSMTLNNGEVTAQVGENSGNMADKAGVGVWLTPLYKWNMGSGFEGGSLEHDSDMGLGGIALGADFTNRIDAETALRIGLAFNVGAGYSDSTGDFNETNNDFSFWGLNLYGAFQKENFVATLDFGFTSTANELNQDLPASMGMGDLDADVDAFAFSAGLNLEYTFNAGMMDITPHAGVRFMSVTAESYDIDSSAGRIASVDEDTQNVWYFPIGVTLSADIESESGWKFTPKLDLGILAAAGDLDATSNAVFTGVPGSMELNMDNVDGFAFNGGLGFELSNEDNGISIGLNYNLTAGEKDTSHMIFANFRYDF